MILWPRRSCQPFQRCGWIFETKLDGWRIIVYKSGPRVRLVSRTNTDHTAAFPKVAAAVAALPADSVIVDGELCAFDRNLMSHIRLLRDAEPDEIATPPMLGAFDVLHLNGRDLRGLPLRERRAILEAQLDGCALELFPVERLPADGMEAWAEVQRRGLEGLVAKPETSRYISGARGIWRKVKVRREGVFILAGIARDRDGYLMLIVGVREGRALRFAGTVGFGVTRRVVDTLYPRIERLVRATSPFRERPRFADCVWLAPRLRAELTYSEVVKGVLRDPVFRGIVRRPTSSGS